MLYVDFLLLLLYLFPPLSPPLFPLFNISIQGARLSLHRNQNHSTYLLYQNIKALLAIVENAIVPEAIKGSYDIVLYVFLSSFDFYDSINSESISFFSSLPLSPKR